MVDPDIQMAGGGGGGGGGEEGQLFRPEIREMPCLKKNFGPFGPQFGLKIRVGVGPDPPDPIPRSTTEIINPIWYKKIHNTFILTCS